MDTKQINKISGSNYKAFAKLANSAFEGLNADQWLQNHIEETPTEKLYGLFEQDTLIAGMRTFEFEMNFSSTTVQAGGVGMLAVDMLHKKEKNAYRLLQYFIQINAESNTNIVMLNPFQVGFYRKMGFGIGTRAHQVYIKPKEFVDFQAKSHLQELSTEDRIPIMECYNRIYSRTHGMTKRFPHERELNRPFLFGRVIGYVEAGEVKGYFVYSINEHQLHIHEMFFENPDVMKEFSTFFSNQSDQIKRVVIHSNLDDIIHFINSPESGLDTMIDLPSSTDHKHIENVGTGVMYRIINVRGFFEELKEKNHRFNQVTISIKLMIYDDLCSENDQPFIVKFRDGEIVEITEEGFSDVELTMFIGEFSSLMMGADNFYSFVKWGLAKVSDESFVHKVNLLFLTSNKPVMTKAF
ncbi:GNAT family N-acetyltransferase [Sediminibacillus massiliensis]|uniref:GNAT family N-acetyltransferase n=1 Tax=Sediminibacillus massiliensis TaxID=1926277 RepID=UPI000988362E|nr:GNAT family N-acetyltransferase [Sediminibacillus massiliensis]